MRDKTYKILRFGCRLPVARTVVNGLYRSKKQWQCLDASVEEAKARLHVMCPRPEGSACWEMPNPDARGYDLSVIIPFYKTERYAVQCIESVLNQVTDYSMEVILVDDGSPDRCGEILDSYADRENVTVIHQVNQGLSMARNSGIAAAKGEYLTFLDSDDYMESGAVQVMMQAAKEYDADVAEGSFRSVTVDGKPRLYNRHQFHVGIHGAGLFGYACGKVIRRKLFGKICFPKAFWFEDAIISNLIYPLAETTVTVEPVVMNYRSNPTSISRSNGGNPKSLQALYITECLLDAMQHYGYPMDRECCKRLLHELGSMVLMRTQDLGIDVLKDIFITACGLVEQYDLIPEEPFDAPMLNELCSAFRQRQFYRWLWASFLV